MTRGRGNDLFGLEKLQESHQQPSDAYRDVIKKTKPSGVWLEDKKQQAQVETREIQAKNEENRFPMGQSSAGPGFPKSL